MHTKRLVTALALAIATLSIAPARALLILTPMGTVKTGVLRGEDPRIAEINAYDANGKRIYVVNPMAGVLDVINAANVLTPVKDSPVDIVLACQQSLGAACPVLRGSEPNSIAIFGDLMAVAVANAVRTNNGHAVFFRLNGTAAPSFLAAVEVGALPDMIFGPGASVAQDLEPEYIAVRGNKAYVTLQENNALAIINIDDATVEQIVGLGLKDYSSESALDPSDQDADTSGNVIHIENRPVFGLYQPDAIHAIPLNGRPYFIMANEGDAREYAGYVEAVRVNSSAYKLDAFAFPNASALKANAVLGRLNVSTASGDLDGDGDFDRIETFGARSVSIRDQQGRLVWDSGDLLEHLSKDYDNTLTVFNTTNTANSRDNRSDDKGIEPESVVVGDVGGRLYAFVGLERDSGIVVFDVSEPTAPSFVTYATNRKLPRNPTTGAFLACTDAAANNCGDLGPEGLTFVPAAQSPTGKALLIVTNEVSSTTTIWQIE